MSWTGTITINPNTPAKFYRAITKKGGKEDIDLDKTTATFIHTSKKVIVSVKKSVDSIDKNKKKYIKVNSELISGLEKYADSKDRKTAIEIIKSQPTYLNITDLITSKNSANTAVTTGSAYQGPSSVYDTKINSGNIKAKKKATLKIYDSPGGAVRMVLNCTNANAVTWEDKNIQTRYNGGKYYIKITTEMCEKMRTRLGVSANKYIGCWVVTGDDVTIVNVSKTKSYSNSTSSNGTNTLPSDTIGSAGGADEVNLESTTADFAEGSGAINFNTNSSLKDLMSNSMNGIFGIPYQWLSTADRRIDGSDFGRKYAEKVAARMPLLFLTPGRPAFLRGATKDQKNNVISTFFGKDKNADTNIVDTLLGDASDSGVSRYYTMNFAYAEYYRYVDVCCQITAKLLELDKLTSAILINGKKVKNFSKYNWSDSLSSKFTDYFSSANAIPFYINANVSVSESINNETMESSLAGSVKNKSEQAKELSFLLNSAASATNGKGVFKGNGIGRNAVNATTDFLTGIPASFANKSAANMISSISNAMGSIAAGGSMMFPELWSSSSMGRSYQIDIKLRSPDGDKLSIYLNVLVPLYHLMCLAAPQMMNNNYNVYFSPFLVKAYCKSMFNIDMGIITSMDITKGKEGDWNINGMPTSIDVSLTIKDLYDVFCLTPYSESTDLLNPTITDIFTNKSSTAKKVVRNTAMMDYLCNNAGLNLNRNEVTRQIAVYQMLRKNSYSNWPNNKWLELQQFVDNKMANVFSGLLTNRK